MVSCGIVIQYIRFIMIQRAVNIDLPNILISIVVFLRILSVNGFIKILLWRVLYLILSALIAAFA